MTRAGAASPTARPLESWTAGPTAAAPRTALPAVAQLAVPQGALRSTVAFSGNNNARDESVQEGSTRPREAGFGAARIRRFCAG